MTIRQRQWLGAIFFVLMFGHFGVNVYSTWLNVARLSGSYDGWSARRQQDGRAVIVSADPFGPAAALQPGDEFVSINGITLKADADILNFNRRVPSGTHYMMVIRRQGQPLELPLVTAAYPITRWLPPIADVLVQLLFLLTGLIVFLLKPGDWQAWLLAIMLCTFTGLINNGLPPMPTALLAIVAIARIVGILFLPFFFHFFLIFPERSPLLKRFPRLERWLYLPFLIILPWFSLTRLIVILNNHENLDVIIRNLGILKHRWMGLMALSVAIGYLAAGLWALLLGYRAADVKARRKLTVILAGSGAGAVNLLLLVIWESFFQSKFPNARGWLDSGLKFTLPLIPLSFAYAIFRHKVIPVSLILRRGVRYLLVSRGSLVLHLATAAILMFLLMEMFFQFMPPMSRRAVGVISTVVGVLLWNLNYMLHRRVLAPAIDRHFFRQSYDAQQIMSGLTQSLRSVTSLPDLLELVATRIQSALQTENVTIFLRSRTADDFQAAYSRNYQTAGNDNVAEQDWHITSDAEILHRLTDDGEPLDVDATVEVQQDRDWRALREMNAALLLPLTTKEEVIGLIVLGPRLGDLPFSRADKHLLMSVAGPTTFAIENARLVERMIEEARRREEIEAENEQRAKEMEEARQLQLSMLPRQVPQLPNLEIAAYMKTAAQVGGDYYDFHLSDSGDLTVVVGDATGHGLKAGTVVTATKSLFNHLAETPGITDIFQHSSRALKRMNMRSLYMAMTMVKIHQHRMNVSSAGMPPVLIYRAAEKRVEEILIKGIPLGSLSGYNYREQEVNLSCGDVVVLMSDGLPERFNRQNEMLDYERVMEVVIRSAGLSPREIIE